jgi:hypothetical protein
MDVLIKVSEAEMLWCECNLAVTKVNDLGFVRRIRDL